MIDKTILKKYTDHKSKAKHRGIDFTLTFEEWWDIWEKSGKWDQRGMFNGSYVMSRNNDQGPYSLDNVKIQSVSENNQEAYDCHRTGPMLGRKHSVETLKKMKGRISPNKGKILSQETKDKISATLAGRKTGRTSSDFTPEWREKLSIAAKNRKKILNTSETTI